ncbi:MAG: LysR family transcriptional regulator [Myxococcota bacterium]
MSEAHILQLNLNLLLALHFLVEERSVTGAAKRAGVTQSAMSRSLARLREMLDDPLLVRTRHGMKLTPRSSALGEPLRRLVADAAAIVDHRVDFDPATARRTLTISSSDYVHAALMPQLLAALEREAPGIDVVLRPESRQAAELLEEGLIDLAITLPDFIGDRGLRTQKLLTDDFVCVLREGHPAADDTWTLESYCALRHALTSQRERTVGHVDRHLERLGLARRVAFVAPSFLAVAHLVVKSDLVATLPRRVARSLADTRGLLTRPVPLPLPGFDTAQFWHERRHRDPAHAWLRRRLYAVASAR